MSWGNRDINKNLKTARYFPLIRINLMDLSDMIYVKNITVDK